MAVIDSTMKTLSVPAAGGDTKKYTIVDEQARTDMQGKAGKVSGGTSGNFVSLTADGDIQDSGHKDSDYLKEHQDISGKADKVTGATNGNFAGLDAEGNLTDSGSKASDFLTEHQDISGKADKVSGGTADNFAGLDAEGNLKDSGKAASDFVAAEDFRADAMPMSATDPTKVSAALTDVKSAFGDMIYGVDEKFSVTPGATNKFPILLVNGEKYTVTNKTGVAITVILYKKDGTTRTISSQLNNNSSVTFIVDSEGYEQIGGWVNTGATGTFDVIGEYSIMEIEDGFNDEITDIKNNLFNYIEASASATVIGWRLNEFDGLCASNANYKTLKFNVVAGTFVKVVSDDRFQFQTVAYVPSSGTSNRVGETYGAGTYILKVPETATYLIVSTPSAGTAKAYYCVDKSEEINQLTKIVDVNVTASATKHENAFYNSNNQIYINSQWDYYTLPVSVGDNFTINTVAGGTVRGWAFRDASSNQLSIASYSGDVVQKEYEDVVAPSGAVELIVNVKKISGYVLSIVKNDDLILNENKVFYNGIALPVYLDRLNQKSNILYGKTLVCCGDSITYGADMDAEGITDSPSIDVYQYSAYSKNWTKKTSDVLMPYGYQIAERNDMTFYNGGVSGATVQGSGLVGSDVPGFSVASGEYTLLPENIDYLLIWYGWNDNAFGTLGAITDDTNASYYGGFNVVLPYLIDKYPYTKIGLIVPFGSSAGHREAVRLLANKWGVAVFDNYQGGTPLYYGKEDSVGVDASIVTSNRAKFQANGAHPNYKGHRQLADMIEEWMRGI